MLMTLGVVLSLLLFVHRPMTITRAFAIWGCFLLALLSKEQGMLLPAVLLAWELIRRFVMKQKTDRQTREAMLLLVLLICFTLAPYLILRENVLHLKFWWDRSFLDPTMNPMYALPAGERARIAISLIGRYFVMLIAPIDLLIEWGTSIPTRIGWANPYLLLGMFLIVEWMLGLVVTLRRRRGVIAFCLISIAVFYLIIGNLVSVIGTIFAERLMYLPSVFLIILFAAALARLRRTMMLTVASILLALASVRTITYAWQWRDALRLYQSSSDHHPEAIRLYLLLSEELQRRNRFEEAKDVLSKAREARPAYSNVWYQSALLAMRMDDVDSADRFMQQAAKLDPQARARGINEQIRERRAAMHPATTQSRK